MISYSVQNLKSIKDSGEIEIKPLNLFIGKNSSGKSSFIRVLPLMKQTLASQTSEPILWYGKYVDYGSFSNSVHRSVDYKPDYIKFNFTFNSYFHSMTEFRFSSNKYQRKVALALCVYDNGPLILDVKVGETMHITFSDKELVVNEISIPIKDYTPSKLLNSASSNYYYGIDQFTIELFRKHTEFDRVFHQIYEDNIRAFIDGFDLEQHRSKLSSIIDNVSEKEYSSDEVETILLDSIRVKVISVLTTVCATLKNEVTGIHYFEPLRARGDRFYRIQGLNIQDVDSDGNNSPMILLNFTKTEMNEFRKWSLDNFGFTFVIKKIANESVSVYVKTIGDKESHNLIDTGFGYTQILPIILSLWKNRANSSSLYDEIFVIEQPELHLHPAMQKDIIDVILKIISSKKQNIKFIIETHSETLVNYIGNKISRNEFDKNDLNLVVCNKNNGISYFETMIINNDGYIQNWPIGFFTK